MPSAAKETQKEVKRTLLGGNGTKKSQKKPKLQPKSRADKLVETARKRKSDCLKKSKINPTSKREITISSFLKKTKSLRKSSLGSQKDESQIITSKDREEDHIGDVDPHKFKKRKVRKNRKTNMELDEPSRFQRRIRYLLIKMKLEQNLIEAYSTEGWKGQSREKIKPERELQRARKQILNCKLGIREVIHQLDLLSSAGRIDDSAVAPDGSVHHEHIICARCKLREAFPDNDIILCDGTCNRAFHQKCLDPPLSTENIPPGDEGWFCKFCKSKIEILEATNAHLGTHFPLDSNWQDIFKEEAVLPDGGNSLMCPEQDWPSDDSNDDDYDPDKMDYSCSRSIASTESDDCSSFISFGSLQNEMLCLTGRSESNLESIQGGGSEFFTGVDSDETTHCEVVCGRRLRPAVDYIKLNDELFGKNAPAEELISEDEDWGPSRQKRRGKESDAASKVTQYGNEENDADHEIGEEEKDETTKTKRSFFRIPPHAIEQLRDVFAENELPSRAVRENLAKQLGLRSEKVNKWFKNARYLALKSRKGEGAKLEEGISESAKHEPVDLLSSKSTERISKKLKMFDEKITRPVKAQQHEKAILQSPANKRLAVDFDDDVSLRFLREKAKKDKKLKHKSRRRVSEAEANMEKLCRLKDKIERLQQVLLGLPNGKSSKADQTIMNQPSIIFVPVAELKVKR